MANDNDVREFLRQAQEITAQVRAAGEQMAQREVVGTAEGGAVRVTLASNGTVRSVRIAPGTERDLPRLERLVTAAVQNALDNVRGVAEELVRPLTDNLSTLTEQ